MSNPTRILSFDGGGIRGIFQAAFLSYIEDVSLLPGIDLLAGTSTGAIIAVALSLGIKPKELVTFYESLGQEIFRKKTFWVKAIFLGIHHFLRIFSRHN